MAFPAQRKWIFHFFSPTLNKVYDIQVFQHPSLRFFQFFFPSFLRFCGALQLDGLSSFHPVQFATTGIRFFLPFPSSLNFPGWNLPRLIHWMKSWCVHPSAKPSLGAFPSLIRLHTNVHRFTAWLIKSKISRFFTSFWQWIAGRRAFNWTYITETLHLSLFYEGMENWPQIFQSCNE